MRHLLRFGVPALVAVSTAALLHAAPQDTVSATGGDITIVPLNHATVQVRHGKHVIDVDPVAQAQANAGTLPAPTIILVTDIHPDHLDPATIAERKQDTTTVVAPAEAAKKLEGATVMSNGETRTVDGVRIEAVPMYNLKRGPSEGQLFHVKGRGNGYVVTLGGKRVYFAGDTECTPEMKALQNIDVAFVPMNLPYTMTPAEAAECVKAFKPDIVYPYHYRGQKVEEFTSALKGTDIEVRARDWYK